MLRAIVLRCYMAATIVCAAQRWHTSPTSQAPARTRGHPRRSLGDPTGQGSLCRAVHHARPASIGPLQLINPVLSPCGSKCMRRPRVREALNHQGEEKRTRACVSPSVPWSASTLPPAGPLIGPLLGTFGPLLVSGLLDRTAEGMKGLVRDDTSWSINLGSFLVLFFSTAVSGITLAIGATGVRSGWPRNRSAGAGGELDMAAGIRRQAAPCQMPNPARGATPSPHPVATTPTWMSRLSCPLSAGRSLWRTALGSNPLGPDMEPHRPSLLLQDSRLGTCWPIPACLSRRQRM